MNGLLVALLLSQWGGGASPPAQTQRPGVVVQEGGVTKGRATVIDFASGATVTQTATKSTISIAGGPGGGAPTTSQYWVGAADGTLSAEKNLGALATGLVINTAGVPSAYAGSTCTAPNVGQTLSASGALGCYQLKLDELANPGADKTFVMANKQIKFTFTAPSTADGAFEIEATGGYSGDLLHVHQHTGSPVAGTDLIHAEASSANVLPLRLTASSAGAQAAIITGFVTASGFTGPLSGNANTATALDHDPADCTAGQAARGVDADGIATGCFTPAGTYSLPDAAAAVTGGVRLTGDLAGTATSPTVVDDSHAHTTTTISGLDAGADFSAGTLSQARGGTGAGALTCSAGQHLTSNGTAYSCSADTGAGTMTRLTATWASSAVANTTGIVGTGGVPMTSPTYGASAPFSFRCVISTTRPATTNGPRYGVAASSGSITRISYTAKVGLAATTRTETKLVAAMTANCAANCSAAMTTGTVAQVMDDTIEGTGQMNASGTLSLYMAPSAGAANTAQIGSNCLWY